MHFIRAAVCAFAVTVVAGCGNSGSSIPSQAPIAPSGSAPRSIAGGSAQRILRVPLGSTSVRPGERLGVAKSLCEKPLDPSRASCFASYTPSSAMTTLYPDSVNGLTPNDLSSLYAYPQPNQQGSAGANQTVAIVVAYDYAAAESDLAVYRQKFGLPPCTTGNGCFRKIGAAATAITSPLGTPSSVSANPTSPGMLGWAAETDTDLDVVSAVCPNCKIVLAEAASDTLSDLTNAVSAALAAKVGVVSLSFGAPETSLVSQFSPVFANLSHVKIVAAAGDWGYGVYFPASDANVIAVGGTSLSVVGSTVVETAWSGTGSGCSTVYAKSSWQNTPSNGCPMRNVVDVAAVADPATGVAVYDSTLFGTTGGWSTFGGTSVSTPIIGAMYALSGWATGEQTGAQWMYDHPSSFLPVTSGSNGTCTPGYLCTAGPSSNYNGPTGLGIPQGLSGF